MYMCIVHSFPLFLWSDPSSVPKRCKPVYGVALLWQPEVVYVYMAVIEQYSSCSEAVEAAAGAIQNLTACNWKVYKGTLILSVYSAFSYM